MNAQSEKTPAHFLLRFAGKKPIAFKGLILGLLLSLVTSLCYGHAMAPSLLQLEVNQGVVNAYWKTPVKVKNAPLAPKLPQACQFSEKPLTVTTEQFFSTQGNLTCSADNLIAGSIGIYNIEKNLTSVLIRYKSENGNIVSGLVNSKRPTFKIPAEMSTKELIKEYLELGFIHLLEGLDHIFFIIALVLLISDRWKLIKAATLFTLGHSLSLACATLGWVSFPSIWVEILIAASITVMAVDILRRSASHWFTKHYVWVAPSFGLLHGLGFASVLGEFQLPQEELIAGLFAFNIGIELGQLFIIAGCLMAAWIVKSINMQTHWAFVRTPTVVAYVFGTISAFWVLERSEPFWSFAL